MSDLNQCRGELDRRNSEPAYDELLVLEIELRPRSPRPDPQRDRQANTFWFWYCLKRLLLWGILFWVLATFASAGQAQSTTTRSFYNSSGSFAGSSTTRGTSSSFYNGSGAFAGSATRQGKWTNFYDSQGR